MRKFKNLALFLSLIMVLSIVGCTPKKSDEGLKVEGIQSGDESKAFPVEIEDKFGNKITIEKEPIKIISLAPSNTEKLFALGLGDKVVGITSNCDYPEEAKSKEVVASYKDMNLERIVELSPDLVLLYGEGDEESNKILKDAGIKILGLESENIEGIMKDIELIGKATGRNNEAKNIVDAMDKKKNEIVEKIKNEKEVTVFYEVWNDPLMGAGKGSFMDELITLSGGKNIAEDAEGEYPQYDLEQLIERNPEIYLSAVPEITPESIKERPGYEVISAVQNDRIYIFEGNDADLVSRPGPRIIEALEIIAKAIHPELFK